MLTPEQVEHIGGGKVLAWREDEEGNLTLINSIGQKVRFTAKECAALLPPVPPKAKRAKAPSTNELISE
jgi:hypothetical protein